MFQSQSKNKAVKKNEENKKTTVREKDADSRFKIKSRHCRYAGILNLGGSSWPQLVQLRVRRTSDAHAHRTKSRSLCTKMVQGIYGIREHGRSPKFTRMDSDVKQFEC